MKLTLGIDEAGRGPAIGPMVMAAVLLDSTAARVLTRAGLQDSKSFGSSPEGRARRATLAERVRAVAAHIAVEVVDVCEIDRRVCAGELNVLEREVAVRFIDRAPRAHRIVADGRTLFAPLCARYPHLEAHNEAESKHAAVAAASIIAKTRRDELFERIRQRYLHLFPDISGGGYANAATRRFLRAYAQRYRRLPPEARHSWPYHYLRDVLPESYLPLADIPQPQLALI